MERRYDLGIKNNLMIKRQASASIPTKYGELELIAYSSKPDEQMPHLAFVNLPLDASKAINVRIHSECLTGDLFGSYRCDCGEQLDFAIDYICKYGGAVIYLRQEGRGIGLINKLKAYNLQDKGVNTLDANLQLGLPADSRDYSEAISILKSLGAKRINLLTNNPLKMDAFLDSGIEVEQRIPIEIPLRKENENYLRTKKDFMGHIFNF